MVFKLSYCSVVPALGSNKMLSEAQNLKLRKEELVRKTWYSRGERPKTSLRNNHLIASRDNYSTLKEYFSFSYVRPGFYFKLCHVCTLYNLLACVEKSINHSKFPDSKSVSLFVFSVSDVHSPKKENKDVRLKKI